MWIYLIFLLVPLIAAWGPAQRKPRLTPMLVAYFIALLIFVGFRNEIGPDWSGYLNIFEVARTNPDTLMREPLFMELNILSDRFGFGIYGVSFVSALLFLAGLFAYAKQTAQPWLALAAVLPYLVFIIGMSGMRQPAAIGIAFYALAHWRKLSMSSRVALIIVAMGFHNSAAFFFVFVLLDGKERLWLRALLATVAVGLLVWKLGGSGDDEMLVSYNQRYGASGVAKSSEGAWAHVALCTLPAIIYLMFRRRIAAAGHSNSIVGMGSIGAVLLFPMIAASSTATDRLALYLSFIQMWIYPALVSTFESQKALVLLLISGYLVSVFLIYFIFGTLAYLYVPYRSILF